MKNQPKAFSPQVSTAIASTSGPEPDPVDRQRLGGVRRRRGAQGPHGRARPAGAGRRPPRARSGGAGRGATPPAGGRRARRRWRRGPAAAATRRSGSASTMARSSGSTDSGAPSEPSASAEATASPGWSRSSRATVSSGAAATSPITPEADRGQGRTPVVHRLAQAAQQLAAQHRRGAGPVRPTAASTSRESRGSAVTASSIGGTASGSPTWPRARTAVRRTRKALSRSSPSSSGDGVGLGEGPEPVGTPGAAHLRARPEQARRVGGGALARAAG